MPKIILFVVIASICQCLKAQQASIDSTLQLMNNAPEDKTALSRYDFLAFHYHLLHNDSMASVYLNKIVVLASKLNMKPEELTARYLLIDDNNHAAALYRAIECLKLAESIRDTVGIISSAYRINLIYSGAEEYGKALEYSNMMLTFSSAVRDSVWQWNSLYAVSSAYINLQKADSGLLYAQEAYRVSLALNDFTQRWLFGSSTFHRSLIIAWSLHALGRAQHLLQDDQLAISYFTKALEFARSAPYNESAIVSIYSSMAESFLDQSKMDSVIKYCRSYLQEDTRLPDVIPIYIYLAKAYERKISDSAVAYYRLAAERRESYFSVKSRSEIVELTNQEDERRKALMRFAAEEKDNRNRNLQLSVLGIGLISFCTLYLLISQTIVVKSGLVKFLGVLALLLVFEFINLFLHPVIDDFTHHSQISMFLIMVSIAALLVPAHHRLEKWVTNKLVEKNKRIRLEAAKKTIATLEGKL